MTNKEYKEMLINGILDYQTKGQFTEEELRKKPIRTLEIIYDNVEQPKRSAMTVSREVTAPALMMAGHEP